MDKMFEKLDMGNVSDGYHTFNELYRYRMLYNAAFFNELAKGDVKVCKSHKHYDGEECFGGGWFIVMAELPTGQISNHYENRYWGLFNIPELETAWKWDGHTPNEAADRIESYLKLNDINICPRNCLGQVRFIYRSVYHDLAVHIINQLNDLIPYIVRKQNRDYG